MVRLLVSKVAARSSARCLPLPCSSSTIAKRRSVRFICASFSPSLPCSSLPYNLLISKHQVFNTSLHVTIQQGGSTGPCRPRGGVRGVSAFLPHPAAGGAREKRPE